MRRPSKETELLKVDVWRGLAAARARFVCSLLSLAALLVGGFSTSASAPQESSGLEVQQAGRWNLPYRAEPIGSEKCGSCHTEHYRDQQTHHMALTGRPVTAETRDIWFSEERLQEPVEWAGKREPPKYRPTSEGVVFEHAGARGPLKSADVAAVFGSGIHGMTPISAEDGKAIRELRLSFSQVRRSWFTTPGSEEDPDLLGSPKSTEESLGCLSCHATLLAWRDERLDARASVFGVQCERCHGPGSAHLEAVLASHLDPWIFNPGRLRADEQVRFCGQCHRQPIDLEPLEITTQHPKLARHAGASLMMSACFRRSPPAETISCIECHDPHRNVNAQTDPYRETCLRCHASPETEHQYERISSSSDCIRCHMPVERRGFYGMTFTSHWIRVVGSPPAPESPETRDYLNYLELLYRNAVEQEGLGPERQSLLRVNLGEVLYGLGHHESAFQWLRDGLSIAPRPRHRLKAAAMFRQSGEIEEAAGVLRDAIEADPNFGQAHYDLGAVLQARGELEGAIASYRRAIELDPDSAAAHAGLGSALGVQGKLEEAIVSLRRALELKPDFLGARANLAQVLKRNGRSEEALEHYRELLRLFPDWLPALNGIAWILATHPDENVRDPEEAVRVAEHAAARSNYRHPISLDTLAAAYAANGDFKMAISSAEKAAEYATTAGEQELAAIIRERLELYRQGRAYLDQRQ